MKKIVAFILICIALIALIVTITIQVKDAAKIDDSMLIKPKLVTADRSVDKKIINRMIKIAQLYYTFWDTGQYKYLEVVISPSFIDKTLPKGRQQGVIGIKAASNLLRSAIPDLDCSIEELIITGNTITARLIFRGTSRGEYMGHPATNKSVAFNAIDILHIHEDKISEEWHIQDDLSLLEQLNIVSVK